MTSVADAAVALVGLGISFVPCRSDKRPKDNPSGFGQFKWEAYSTRLPSLAEARGMISGAVGIGIIGGAVSGNLETLDFEDYKSPVFEEWRSIVASLGYEEAVKKCYHEISVSGGHHLVYRCESPVDEGGGELCFREGRDKDGKEKVLCVIETRSEGQYACVWPTQGYKPVSGSLKALPVLTAEEREVFLTVARNMGLVIEPATKHVPTPRPNTGSRVGDDFNAKADWRVLLCDDGWTLGNTLKDGATEVCRPGKAIKDGISGKCGLGATDLLYVFSTEAPVPVGLYTKFQYWMLTRFPGDYGATISDLKRQGYQGQPSAVAEVKERSAPLDGQWIDDVAPESPSFIWEPYILRAQMNLIDGKGGTNKSTFLLALASALSRGETPFGEPCEPVKTVYFTTEDTAGAYRSTLDKLGHFAPKSIKVVGKGVPVFNAVGIKEIAKMVSGEGFGMVVLDPVINLMHTVIRNPLERMEVGPVIERVREQVCFATGAGVISVRHDAMAANGRDLDERGAGARVWPDVHRSQIAIVPMGGRDPRRYVHHAKASILVERGEPFAYGWTSNGFCFWHPTDEELVQSGYDRFGERCDKDQSKKLTARQFLDAELSAHEWKRVDEVKAKAKALGIDPDSRTFSYAVKDAATTKREGFGKGSYCLWRKKDPFDDRPPSWAGLD